MQDPIPELAIEFPRRVRALHQIEISSRCSLACSYCPSRDIVKGKYKNRSAQDMPRHIFFRTLEWVSQFVQEGTQHELNLAGIGESTLHPDFGEFVVFARRAVGPNVALTLATNGLIADETLTRVFKAHNVRVWVSLHKPERAKTAVELYRNAGVLHGVSIDPSVNSNSWAGQVDWPDTGARLPCQWLRQGKAFVFSDGRISTCCLDASGCGVIGHVDDEIVTGVWTKPYDLCSRKCYQRINVKDYDQSPELP